MEDLEPYFKGQRADRPQQEPRFDADLLSLANRNSGTLLETLALDITPTGAHYLLNHFDVPLLDAALHKLTLSGLFERPMTLSMADIRARPQVSMPVTLECAGNGRAGITPEVHSMPWGCEAVGTSEWTGAPLVDLLRDAGPSPNVVEFAFTGADYGFDDGHPHHFGRSMTLEQIGDTGVLLVYAMNGAPLLPQHGAPLRLIVPGWYGMASVKWLTQIEALPHAYDGFQQMRTYRLRQTREEPGEPVQKIQVRSLMVPPGVPDWVSRKRYLKAGPVRLVGKAWSGYGAINSVEVEIGGAWVPAQLGKAGGPNAWTPWYADWDAVPGQHRLCCRATDATGVTQPLEASWNLGGFLNNAIQIVDVLVE